MSTIGQLYKKQGGNGPIARRNEFTVLLEAIYVEEGFNVKGQIYRDVVDSMKSAYVKGNYVPKMVVQANEDGTKFKVIDGHHRFTALTELVAEGHEYRRVEVEGFTGSEADQVNLMIQSSQGRNLTPLERATGYDRLINKFGWTRQEVADEMLVHLSSVAHHMAIAELPDSIKELIRADRIAADYAVEVHRKHGEAAVIAMVEGSGEVKATRKNTNAWRPASGKKVCTILKGINVRPEGACMVARFTPEEWEEVQAVLATLGDDPAIIPAVNTGGMMTLEEWGWPLTIAILSAGIRCTVDGKYASLYGVVQAILLGLLFGSITNLYLLDYLDDKGELLSHTKRAAYVGVASAFSQELFIWLKRIMADPIDYIRRGKNGS